MKTAIGFMVACLLGGVLFDRAKTSTKVAMVSGALATGYGLYKLVEKANEPGDPYFGMEESPRDWV